MFVSDLRKRIGNTVLILHKGLGNVSAYVCFSNMAVNCFSLWCRSKVVELVYRVNFGFGAPNFVVAKQCLYLTRGNHIGIVRHN